MERKNSSRSGVGSRVAVFALVTLALFATRGWAALSGAIGQGTAANGVYVELKSQFVELIVSNLHSTMSCEFQLDFLSAAGDELADPVLLLDPFQTGFARFAQPAIFPARRILVLAAATSLTEGCEATARATVQIGMVNGGATVSSTPLAFGPIGGAPSP